MDDKGYPSQFPDRTPLRTSPGRSGQNIEKAAKAISQPNNILGIEYKAIKRFNSNIKQ